MPLTQEQRARRRLSIGGSDISAIAGVNPHKSVMDLYLEKAGLAKADDRPESDAALWGQLLEEPIGQFYAMRHHLRVDSFADTLVHPSYTFLTAHPDRIVVAEERLLEIKTTGIGGIDLWHDPDTPNTLRPPQHVMLQVNWYLGFLGWAEADVVLLHFNEWFNQERYQEFPLSFDGELFDLEVQLAMNFWGNHVQAGVPPEGGTAEDVSEYLSLVHQKYTDDVLEATDEHTGIAKRLHHAKAQKKHWEEQVTLEANGMKAMIGGKAGIRGEQFIYTWKQTASGGVDWQSLARSFHPTEEQIKRFTRSGYRREYFRYHGDRSE